MDNNKDIIEETGEIIDVEPEAPDAAPEAVAEKPHSKPLNLPLILSIIAIIAVMISGVAAYRYWVSIVNDLAGIQQRIDSTFAEQQKLVGEIDKARSLLNDHEKKIADQDLMAKQQSEAIAAEKSAITEQASAMQQAVEELNAKVGRTDNQWQIAEAEYLMRVANHRLALAGDVATALTALQQADAKLLASGDLGLLKIREKLGQEISALKSASVPDIAGMAATLQALATQVPALQLSGTVLDKPEKENTAGSTSAVERSFDTLLHDSWQGFRELVVIRKHDKPVSAMLPPSQQFFLYQNLQLQLESARLSLLRQETILYRSSLQTALDWLNAFFDPAESQTISMAADIKALSGQSLQPSLPDISASLNLLAEYRGAKP